METYECTFSIDGIESKFVGTYEKVHYEIGKAVEVMVADGNKKLVVTITPRPTKTGYQIQGSGGLVFGVFHAGSATEALAMWAKSEGYTSWEQMRKHRCIDGYKFDGVFRIVLTSPVK